MSLEKDYFTMKCTNINNFEQTELLERLLLLQLLFIDFPWITLPYNPKSGNQKVLYFGVKKIFQINIFILHLVFM